MHRKALGPEGQGGPRRFSIHRLSGSTLSGFKSLPSHILTQWSWASSFHFLSLFPNLRNGDNNPILKGWFENGMHRNWHTVGGQHRLGQYMEGLNYGPWQELRSSYPVLQKERGRQDGEPKPVAPGPSLSGTGLNSPTPTLITLPLGASPDRKKG